MKEKFVGHKIKFLNSLKTGITLEFNNSSSEDKAQKYSVSYDEKIKIERVAKDQISLGAKVVKPEFFKRLIRDIQSIDEETREISSEILCDFIEFDIEHFDLKILNAGIEKIIEQIKTETNTNAEHKLVEGLFEFIWHKKISKKAEIQLLERLTEIDKYYVWSYLGDEIVEDIKSYNSKILNQYCLENIEKWKEKDINLYGKEKTERHYKNLKKKTNG